MSRKQKIYAVIFTDGSHVFYKSWPACKKATKGGNVNTRRSFDTIDAAKDWFSRAQVDNVPTLPRVAHQASNKSRSIFPNPSSFNTPFWNRTRGKRVIDH